MQNNNNVGLDSPEFCGENDILPDADGCRDAVIKKEFSSKVHQIYFK